MTTFTTTSTEAYVLHALQGTKQSIIHKDEFHSNASLDAYLCAYAHEMDIGYVQRIGDVVIDDSSIPF